MNGDVNWKKREAKKSDTSRKIKLASFCTRSSSAFHVAGALFRLVT